MEDFDMTGVPTALNNHNLEGPEDGQAPFYNGRPHRTAETPACVACKERKVKCIPHEHDPTSCKYCFKEGIPCLNQPVARTQPRTYDGPGSASLYPDPSHLGFHAHASGPYGFGNGATPYGSVGFSGRQLGLPQLDQWRDTPLEERIPSAAETAAEESSRLREEYELIDGGAGQAATRKAAALARRAMTDRIYDAVGLPQDGFRPETLSWAVDIPGIDDGETEAEDTGMEDFPLRGESSRGRGRGGKKKGWRAVLKGTDHANIGRVPRNTISKRGRPSDRAKNAGRKRKKEIDPGPDFKRVMARANNAFMEQDHETALDFVRQAIAFNPEIWSAHSLLSQILESQGHHADAIEALRYGIPTTTEADNWQHLADLMTHEDLVDEDDLDTETIEQAVWYLSKAVNYRKPETAQWEIRKSKFRLYKILQKRGQNNKNARMEARNILKIWPTRTLFLKEYAVLCASWAEKGEQELAIRKYDEAFEYYMANFDTFSDEYDPDTEDWEHLNIYLEMVELAGNPWMGIQKAKRIARWLLGRKHDTFWDRVTEIDCEFDTEEDRRRSVPEWMWPTSGPISRDPAQYGAGMPIEIKVRLGKLRLKMGHEFRDEALRHFSELLQVVDEVENYRDTFEDVAQTLRKDDQFTEALKYFGPLRDCEEADHPLHGLSDDVWYWMGVCYHYTGSTQDAIVCFNVIVTNRSNTHGHQLEATAKLAKLCEETEDLDRARYLCNDLIKQGRHDLLLNEGVNMIPEEVRYKPVILPQPIYQVRKYNRPALNPRKEPNTSFKPLAPAPITLRDGSTIAPTPYPVLEREVLGSSLIGGPTTQEVELPPALPEAFELPKLSSKKGRGNLIVGQGHKNIVQKISGDVAEGDDAEDESEQEEDKRRAPKRPRLKKKKAKAPTSAELNAQRRLQMMHDVQHRVWANCEDVRKHRAAMEAGDDEATEAFVQAALGMLDDFTDMKVFFPDRDKFLRLKEGDVAQFKRHGKMPDDAKTPERFLNLTFTDWHHTFSDLALIYARNAEQDKCYRILQDVLAGANCFYHNIQLKMTTYAISFYCGMAFNDNQFIIDLARELVKDTGDRGGEAFQVFAAVNRFAFGSNWFSAGPTQKWMLRMVKAHDFLAMPEDVRERFDFCQQTPHLTKKAADLDGELQNLDAGVLLTYGHMVAVANHSFSALPYYYRALALYPDNICVNLSIATMWIQNSMKRQTPNRQYGLHQGLAYLFRYYDLRVASGRACHIQEAEYNVARMWHYLGLSHLALPIYEKVLRLSDEVQAEARSAEGMEADGVNNVEDLVVEDFAQEAAFALQGMYALAGNDAAARSVTEKWLVI